MSCAKTVRRWLMLVGMLISPMIFAEDIDLYQGGADVVGTKPNVLIVIDNSANWNASNQGWPGGLKQGESELRALSSVIAGLPVGQVRVGLMFFVKGTGQAKDGGYVRFGIRDMEGSSTATNQGALKNILDGLASGSVFNDENTGQQVASANTKYGEGFYEAYRYFSGLSSYAGPADLRDYSGNGSPNIAPYKSGSIPGNALASASSTTYQTPLSANAACAKNYIIFIGNGFPVNSSVNPNELGDATLSAYSNYFATQIYDEGNKTTYADEWTKFLYEVGASNPPWKYDADGVTRITSDGKITTYTIDVYKDQQDEAQTALLKSMAAVGGGEYFAATSEEAIKLNLQSIFNRIQAVDSVFTSASLPVSVNTQGTYLNQVYMGVFRPDVKGRPRWPGNLKEYKFGVTKTASGADSLFLAQADGVTPAVDPATGYIKNDAVSLWTSSVAPAAGFWAFNPKGVGGQYDTPDGDLVEKGAAAQKLRALGATNRKVYTCTGSPNCAVNTEPPLFKTDNTALVTALTGTDVAISSLARVGNTVTVTTATDPGLNSPTDTVTISGASVAAYNATWTVTKVDGTHFTFQVVKTPATPATGSAMTVSSGSATSQNIITAGGSLIFAAGTVTVNLPAHGFSNNQSVTISGANISSDMATASTKCSGYNAGTPSASSPCEYNGTYNITVVDASTFTYTPATTSFGSVASTTSTIDPPSTIPNGTVVVSCGNGGSLTSSTLAGSTIVRAAGSTAGSVVKVTVTLSGSPASNCLQSGSLKSSAINSLTISLTGSTVLDKVVPSPLYGAACGTGTTALQFCFNVTLISNTVVTGTTTIVPTAATGTVLATGIPTKPIMSISRTDNPANNTETVTITTGANGTPIAHGFTSSPVTVAGVALGSELLVADYGTSLDYNGTKTTSGNTLAFTSTTITYTITTGPTASSSGGTVSKGSAVNASTLINWVRGVDNKEDENGDKSLTDVRASIHGDVLHSRPLIINYGGSPEQLVAFYGSNDGTFRAVKVGDAATDGVEKWSFVVPEHFNTLGRLYNNSPVVKFPNTSMSITPTPTKRDYFFDGNIGYYQSADRTTTHIYISMRRGGRFIYALDVSNPDTPKFLWKKSNSDTGFSELGYTFSQPVAVPLKKTAGVACVMSDASTYTRALIMGAGYDQAVDDATNGSARTPTMGRGVFVLNASDGTLIKLLQPTDAGTKYSVASDVTLLDADSDGCVDRVYAVDTGANIMRYDMNAPYDVGASDSDKAASLAAWKTYKIASLGDVARNGGSDDRRFLYPTELVRYIGGNVETNFLMVGSGNREEPSSVSVADKFFLIKDSVQVGDAVTNYDFAYDPATLTLNTARKVKIIDDLTPVTNFDGATTSLSIYDGTVKGWYIDYLSGEKSVNAALAVAGTTYFGTNQPKAANPNQCTPNLGNARGYAVNFLNGTAAFDRNGDSVRGASDLYATFARGGLPPSPTTGVVKIGDDYQRFVMGTGGEGTTGSTVDPTKVEANPSSGRTQVYWYFQKD